MVAAAGGGSWRRLVVVAAGFTGEECFGERRDGTGVDFFDLGFSPFGAVFIYH
jgi:hypothetical protein